MKGKEHWISVIGGSFLTLIVYKILNHNDVYLGFIPAILVWFGSYWVIKTIVKKLNKNN